MRSGWYLGAGVHENQLPQVSVEVFERMPVHEPAIFRLARDRTARRDRRCDDAVDFRTALARKADQHFGARFRVAELLLREGPEERLGHEHDERRFVEDHAGRALGREPRLEREAELGEKHLRAIDILYGEIYVDLARHWSSFVGTVSCSRS